MGMAREVRGVRRLPASEKRREAGEMEVAALLAGW